MLWTGGNWTSKRISCDAENDPPALTGQCLDADPAINYWGWFGIRLEADPEMVDGDASILSN